MNFKAKKEQFKKEMEPKVLYRQMESKSIVRHHYIGTKGSGDKL